MGRKWATPSMASITDLQQIPVERVVDLASAQEDRLGGEAPMEGILQVQQTGMGGASEVILIHRPLCPSVH